MNKTQCLISLNTQPFPKPSKPALQLTQRVAGSSFSRLKLTTRLHLEPRGQWRTHEFCSWVEGGSKNSVEDTGQTERGSGGGDGSPLVRGSGGSCNLVQKISFHIVKIFLIFGTLRLFMMTTNLFVIVNVNQLRTGGSFRILLPFFPNILGCWCSKFSNF